LDGEEPNGWAMMRRLYGDDIPRQWIPPKTVRSQEEFLRACHAWLTDAEEWEPIYARANHHGFAALSRGQGEALRWVIAVVEASEVSMDEVLNACSELIEHARACERIYQHTKQPLLGAREGGRHDLLCWARGAAAPLRTSAPPSGA
jgi:hypothetical protein